MRQQVDPFKNRERVMAFVESLEDGAGARRLRIKEMLAGPVGLEYFSAPASSRTEYHGCYPGGLAQHSLDVVRHLKLLSDSLAPGRFPAETLAFVGLFHDLGKAGDGDRAHYVPMESDWHRRQGIMYKINDECRHMPTSERSLFVLQAHGIRLEHEEYLAIRLNDGQYDEANRGYRMKEPDLALLLHFADRWAVQLEKSDG